ncbi:MAG: DNA-directed RNA polymerase subunit omega [Lachnospiraceae bacterium]|nr:DNA-directed RNA polymerase subunit omega [Lachnospiraceae bacterium]
MIHPSYKELIDAVNADVPENEEPLVHSRYSIVIGTAKRARQLVDGAEPLTDNPSIKPLSTAVEEMWEGKVKVLGENDPDQE